MFKGASRFALKEPAHPAGGGTSLLKQNDALPSNTITGFETAFTSMSHNKYSKQFQETIICYFVIPMC
jgi:hypothetical protein